jgi:hypothetical protein
MLIADVALVVAMLAASFYGAVALPTDGMVPVDLGAGTSLHWMPKRIGLVLWPAIGVVAYALVGVAAGPRLDAGSRTVGLTVALGLILAAQLGSIAIAVRRSGRP